MANEPQKTQQQVAKVPEVVQLLTNFEEDIKLSLPKHLPPERMLRVALSCLNRVPGLLQCNPMSVFNAIVTCSQLGLEPGVLGRAWLIPFGKECQLIIGYQGLVDLARRSGRLISIQAHVVYEKDFFKFSYGLTEVLEHRPFLDGDAGKPKLVYGVAKLRDGGHQMEVMSVAQVEAIRTAAPSAKSSSSPWKTHWDEMAKKTVIRRLCKLLPMSVEFQTVLDSDDRSGAELPGLDIDWGAKALEASGQMPTQTIPIDSVRPSDSENRGHDESMKKVTQADVDAELAAKRSQQSTAALMSEDEMRAETERQDVAREARDKKKPGPAGKGGGWE